MDKQLDLFFKARTELRQEAEELRRLGNALEYTGNIQLGNELRVIAAAIDESGTVMKTAFYNHIDKGLVAAQEATANVLSAALAGVIIEKASHE